MSYQLVEQLHKKAVPVGRLCRVLGVSRSGYYGSRQRAKLAPKACLVSTQLKAEFAASGKIYGSRRLSAVLCAQGLRTGRHRVRRLMREHGLCALWRRKFVHTTDSGHALPVSANVLARRFNPSGPNQAWVSDITYIRTRSGWLYLAVVLDLYARKVVGWAMAPTMHAELVCAALQLAIAQRQPTPGLIVHSDRGSQGVFNRSSQHWVVDLILDIRSRLQLASSNQASCGAWYSARELRPGALGRSTATGLCPSGSIAAEDRWCSRSYRAARDCGELRRRPLLRIHS